MSKDFRRIDGQLFACSEHLGALFLVQPALLVVLGGELAMNPKYMISLVLFMGEVGLILSKNWCELSYLLNEPASKPQGFFCCLKNSDVFFIPIAMKNLGFRAI